MPREASHVSLPTFDVNRIKGKRVLLRVDFNVPIKHGEILDDFRIKKILPTLNALREAGSKITLLSHLTEQKQRRGFRELLPALSRACGHDIAFANDIARARVLQHTKNLILLENLRAFPGEEKNDEYFAKKLAMLGDYFVNEDFSQSHRPYASMMRLPFLLPSFAGPLFLREITRLGEAINPTHPFLVILAGIKFETKLGVLRRFSRIADRIFIGGALANVAFKVRGFDIGASLFDKASQQIIGSLITSPKIMLPIDVRTDSGSTRLMDRKKTMGKERILDSGPETIAALKKEISRSAMVLWNGPLGALEEGFGTATIELAEALAQSKAKVIVGGGDTVAILNVHNLSQKFYHVSTGGGAMLQFLANGTLPGIDALREARSAHLYSEQWR